MHAFQLPLINVVKHDLFDINYSGIALIRLRLRLRYNDFVPSGRMLSGRTHISPCQLGEYQEDECQLDEDRLDELIIIPK